MTGNLTRLTESFNHVIPKKEETQVERCKHGYPSESCWDCRDEARAKEREKEIKENMKNLAERVPHYMAMAGIPPKFINGSFDTFIGNDKLVAELSKHENENIVLFGNTGCGKTHLAVALVRNAFIKNTNYLLALDWGGKIHHVKIILFKPVPDLLLEIRQSFRDGSETSEEDIIKKYCSADLLVLDDLGSEKTSEYSITTLYIIIDRRDRELRPTIITTNLSQKEIEERLGARIASRLAGMKNIKINMPDYRKKRS